MHILTDKQETIVKKEREILTGFLGTLIEFNQEPNEIQTLKDSIMQLDELFLLVVVGEFNSGKSAFINAFLGQKLLTEGVTPTTTQINLLRYGEERQRIVVNEHQHILTLPIDWLSEINIVDTPGTNAIIREHEAITHDFIPRSDLILFVTSVDRPFTESERKFLERIRDWGKKIVIVINKIDILEDLKDVEQVRNFVAENALKLLGVTPEIFPLSARLALRSKLGELSLWSNSQFGSLESFIKDSLDEKSRIKLKLLNPIGVSIACVEGNLNNVHSRSDMIKDDIDMLTDIGSQLTIYQEDMQRDFDFRMSDIENDLFEMEQRGEVYFDETFRLARLFDLIKNDRIKNEFSERVIGEVPKIIERKVNEIISWLVGTELKQWQAVYEHLAERRRAYQERMLDDFSSSTFQYDHALLIDIVEQEAHRVIETYDKSTEAQAIARSAQEAVAASVVMEVGAVGLGALVAMLATTATADITGVLLASVVATLGLFVIPAKKRVAKSEMRLKVGQMRQQLICTLRNHFENEMKRSIERIETSIAPYTRFIRAERDLLSKKQSQLNNIRDELARLKVAIEEL
jgi:small GTP-binding protein